MAFSWSEVYNSFGNRIKRKNIAAFCNFELTLTLIRPSESSAWQEGIQLAYVFALLGRTDIDTIMKPIQHGFRHNFNREGDATGKWQQLADVTVEERAQLVEQGSFFGGLVPGFTSTNPILQRTGEYLMSWADSGHPLHGREDLAEHNVSRTIMEGSDDPRAENLSLGLAVQNLPARPVNAVDDIFATAMAARIDATLAKYIQTVRP